MIKQIVHIENIKRNGTKHQFQIKLPLNAKRLIEIKITCDPSENTYPDPFQNEIGWLWLRLSEKRDVFYAHRISTYKWRYNLSLPRIDEVNPFNETRYWHHGKKEEFATIHADLKTNLLEGYYIDTIDSRVQNYKLRIYLKLEI